MPIFALPHPKFKNPFQKLVAIQIDMLGSRSLNSPVLPDQKNSDPPSATDRSQSKSSRGTETDNISWLVGLGPQVGTIDVTNLATHIGHGKDNLKMVNI